MAYCALCDHEAPTAGNCCVTCGAEFILDRATYRRRRITLELALAWSAMTLIVCFLYHIREPPGVRSITINGETYVGHPPALTLFQSDPVSVVYFVVVLSTGLLVATLDLVLRVRHRSERLGVAAIIVGLMVAAFSLFGLLYGIASIGVVGVLLTMTGRPLRKTAKTRVSATPVS